MVKQNSNLIIKSALVLFIAISLLSLYLFISSHPKNNLEKSSKVLKPEQITLKIRGTQIIAEVVKTPDELSKGLSTRQSLPENSGMYFVLGERKATTFWMKDMLFPLDIIWIDSGKIVGIEKNAPVPTGGYISTFTSPKPITHVLEVNAMFTEKHNIEVDDNVVIIR